MAIVAVQLTDTINSWRIKFNQVAAYQGDLVSLTTSANSDLVSAINEINLGGNSPLLMELQDVQAETPLDGQFIRYDINTALWNTTGLLAADITQFQSDLSIAESQIVFSSTFATETYVTNQISNLIDGAPETLDTLNEIAAAIGDDPSFYSSVATETWVLDKNYIDSASLGLSLVTEDAIPKLRADRRIQVPHGSDNGVQFGLNDFDVGGGDRLWIYADVLNPGSEDLRLYIKAENDESDKVAIWTPDANGFVHTVDGITENVIYHAGNFDPSAALASSSDGLDSLQNWVIDQGYATSLEVDSLQGWVISQDYATETWVGEQNYLTSLPSGIATETWVGEQNYLIATDLASYATTTWVGEQNYLTSVPDAVIDKLEDIGDVTITNPSNVQVLKYSEGEWLNSADLVGSASSGIASVVEDTTPQLGGGLDVNSNDITGDGNIQITGSITTQGTGGTIVASGEIRSASNVVAYSSSDITMKENIRRIPNPLEVIRQLDGISFDWTEEVIHQRGGIDGYYVRRHDIGLLAQQVIKVIPDIVVKRPTDGKLAVKYEGLIPVLVEAIKELTVLSASAEEAKKLSSRIDVLEQGGTKLTTETNTVQETPSAVDLDEIAKLRQEIKELKSLVTNAKNIGIRNQSAIHEINKKL